jgi:hypothetical protein
MRIPGPRETILQSRFDASTQKTLIEVFDRLWTRCTDRNELTGYRLAGSLLDSANSGERQSGVIEERAAGALRRLTCVRPAS